MEKIMKSLIDNWTKGVDTYTHNGSTWLIFTDSKKWVIELTEDKTLWYNYNFFKQIFSLTSLDVVENQQYITKWVEDNIINKVKDTRLEINITEGEVDDIIQDGVRHTKMAHMKTDWSVEDTIENGVKETKQKDRARLVLDIDGRGLILETNLVIRDGVKETNHVDVMGFFNDKMEDALQNGVNHTFNTEYMPKSMVVDIIDNGVKRSIPRQYVGGDIVDKVIDKGVIETHDDVYHHKGRIDGVIKNGVKETKTPGNGNGDTVSSFEWLDENNTRNVPKMIDDIIENGEKINGTYAGGQRQSEKCKSVVEYGKQI